MKLDRIQELTQIIQDKKRISIKELAQIVHASPSTLRRDLIYLENQGLIKRNHGEVLLNSFNTLELSHMLRENKHVEYKRTIASLAQDFVGVGMCIFLDSSTTVFELCRYLCSIDNLIIVTNGLKTAQYLAEYCNPSIKIFMSGGEIKHHSTSVINRKREDSFINHFNIDLAICSARGITRDYVFEASLSQALSKKHITEIAKDSILLIDQSKFNKEGFFKISKPTQYSAIISNTLPPQDFLDALENSDTEWVAP